MSVSLGLHVLWPGEAEARPETEGQPESITAAFCTGDVQFGNAQCSCCHGKPEEKSRMSQAGEGRLPWWGGRNGFGVVLFLTGCRNAWD